MKKTIFAALMLLMLLGLSLASSHHLDRLTGEVLSAVEETEKYAGEERFSDAESALLRGMTRWESAALYTGVVLRHDQTEEVQDIFYDALSQLRAEDSVSAQFELGKLRCHLENLRDMEHITLRSIL